VPLCQPLDSDGKKLREPSRIELTLSISEPKSSRIYNILPRSNLLLSISEPKSSRIFFILDEIIIKSLRSNEILDTHPKFEKHLTNLPLHFLAKPKEGSFIFFINGENYECKL
jgi:hypothetical protein